MKNILIISELFAPQNRIGAIRPTKICKFLKREGYFVDVVTSGDYIENHDEYINRDEHPNNIYYISHSAKFGGENKKNIKIDNKNFKKKSVGSIKKSRAKQVLSIYKRQILSLIKSINYYINFKRYIKLKKIDINKYDVVLSTYGPTSSNLCGLFLKRKYKKIKWIADFRDPMVYEDTPIGMRFIYNAIQRKVVKKCDFITAVSRGYLDRICKYDKSKSIVLTNGFDYDDLDIDVNNSKDDKFTFAYAGALYEGKRDASILFKIIKELIDEGIMEKLDFEFKYAGNDYAFLYQQAKKYNLEENVKNYGFIPRNKSLELLNSCRYLILLTWNSIGEEGVIPGKFFEYLMLDKKIIAIINGNLENSEIYRLINDSNSGIGYEECRSEKHYYLLKKFIKEEYDIFKKKSDREYTSNRDIIELYNYKNITKELINLIEMLC